LRDVGNRPKLKCILINALKYIVPAGFVPPFNGVGVGVTILSHFLATNKLKNEILIFSNVEKLYYRDNIDFSRRSLRYILNYAVFWIRHLQNFTHNYHVETLYAENIFTASRKKSADSIYVAKVTKLGDVIIKNEQLDTQSKI